MMVYFKFTTFYYYSSLLHFNSITTKSPDTTKLTTTKDNAEITNCTNFNLTK